MVSFVEILLNFLLVGLFREALYFYQNAEGTALAPFDCWLVLRGIKTMALRVCVCDVHMYAYIHACILCIYISIYIHTYAIHAYST